MNSFHASPKICRNTALVTSFPGFSSIQRANHFSYALCHSEKILSGGAWMVVVCGGYRKGMIPTFTQKRNTSMLKRAACPSVNHTTGLCTLRAVICLSRNSRAASNVFPSYNTYANLKTQEYKTEQVFGLHTQRY